MAALFSFPLLFLQASLSALITCTVAWAMCEGARRRWPGLASRRAPWLLAPLAGCVTLVLVLLPASSQMSLLTVAPLSGVAGLKLPSPGDDAGLLLQEDNSGLPAGELVAPLAWLWFATYLTGGTRYALRWTRGQRHLRALACAAERLEGSALRAHPAFAQHDGPLPPVLELDVALTPMLAGLLHPLLLLPRHVRSLPPLQQQLIVAHELMHLSRHDHVWQHAGTLVQGLLWFIPAVHRCNQRLQWALETGCDSAVLAGRPESERRSYAAALLAQFAVQVRAGRNAMLPLSLAFGLRDAQAVADRIRLIRDGKRATPARLASATMVLLLPALCGASVLLQPQFALEGAAPAPKPHQVVAASPATVWQAPLARLHVTSTYGSTNRPGGKSHDGMDFGTRRGTAVLAPADGRVAISTDHYEGGDRYGKVMVIEHAGGIRSLYAHLDGRLVQAGDTVHAGQHIAATGATGKVTGPHLHFEVTRGGIRIDPQALLAGSHFQ